MPLSGFIRALFPQFVPRTVTLGSLGDVTNDKYGYWALRNPITLGDFKLGLGFDKGAHPPGDNEINRFEAIKTHWASVWVTILERLAHELEYDGPNGEREQFLKDARPVWLLILRNSEPMEWNLGLSPEIYGGHIVTMRMRGLKCDGFTLDG
jgi:hypothetical protein